MFRRITRLGAAAMVILLGGGLIPGMLSSDQSASNNSDAWRRTAQGWQHMSQWTARPVTYDPPPAATRIHPLAVAIWEIVASWCMLALFVHRGGGRPSSSDGG